MNSWPHPTIISEGYCGLTSTDLKNAMVIMTMLT